jgi:hypothetical protein
MFSPAEWFLLAWASAATVVAVRYQARYKEVSKFAIVAQRVFYGMTTGCTVVTKDDDSIVFTYSDEGVHDEIRVKTRQG